MGLIRFLVPPPDRLSPAAIRRAYITGPDEVPWPSRIVGTDDGLIVDRPMGESGSFHIPWVVEGYGETTLSTASLMERTRPYLLEVELARGTLNRIRNQIATWQSAGLTIPEGSEKGLAAAVQRFSEAATRQDEMPQACQIAGEVLRDALALSGPLGLDYARQTLESRRKEGEPVPTLLGANLGRSLLDEMASRNFLAAFNAAVVPFTWQSVEAREGKPDWTHSDRQVEWCLSQGLKVCGGPLVRFDPAGVPDWLYLWEDDEENLFGFMTEHVRRVVSRYQSKVHVWHAAARMNTGDFLGLSDEQKLRMAVRVLEVIRQNDARTPLVVSFEQPWGEYISHHEMDLPLHLADALIRSDLPLAGVGLEINLGYHPRGTLRRDVLEFSRQLDRWSLLGVPLLVTVTVPSGAGEDKQARLRSSPLPDDWSPEKQEEWIRFFIPVLLAKPTVQAIFWNQLHDSDPHDYPHGGLIDPQSRPKPALAQLAALRKTHLQ